MSDNSENEVQIRMSYITWRLLLKPEALFFVFLPILNGVLFSWYKIGYFSFYKTTLYIIYLLVITLLAFSFHEFIQLNAQLALLKTTTENAKKVDNKKNDVPPQKTTEVKKILYVRGMIILLLFIFFIVALALSCFFVFKTIGLLKGILLLLFFLVQYLTYFLNSIYLSEIFAILFWSFSGIFVSILLITDGSVHMETIRLSTPLLLSSMLYSVMRYYILDNKVFAPEVALEASDPVVPDKKIKEKSSDAEQPNEGHFFKPEKNAYWLLMMVLVVLLFISVMSIFFVSGIIAGLSLVSFFWGLNIIKQIIWMDFSNPVHLSYMYSSTKKIYYSLNAAILIGGGIEFVLRYKLHWLL